MVTAAVPFCPCPPLGFCSANLLSHSRLASRVHLTLGKLRSFGTGFFNLVSLRSTLTAQLRFHVPSACYPGLSACHILFLYPLGSCTLWLLGAVLLWALWEFLCVSNSLMCTATSPKQSQQPCMRVCPSVSVTAAVTLPTPGGYAAAPPCTAVGMPGSSVSLYS